VVVSGSKIVAVPTAPIKSSTNATRPPRLSDRLLLCSDGLTDMVSHTEINTVLNQKKSTDAIKALIQTAMNAGGKGNTSVIIVYNRSY